MYQIPFVHFSEGRISNEVTSLKKPKNVYAVAGIFALYSCK